MNTYHAIEVGLTNDSSTLWKTSQRLANPAACGITHLHTGLATRAVMAPEQLHNCWGVSVTVIDSWLNINQWPLLTLLTVIKLTIINQQDSHDYSGKKNTYQLQHGELADGLGCFGHFINVTNCASGTPCLILGYGWLWNPDAGPTVVISWSQLHLTVARIFASKLSHSSPQHFCRISASALPVLAASLAA